MIYPGLTAGGNLETVPPAFIRKAKQRNTDFAGLKWEFEGEVYNQLYN
jgi:hypothetical protein